MNCKRGDLAYIVVPSGFDRLLHGRIVEVGVDGECQIGTIPPPGQAAWLCRFPTPWFSERCGIRVSVCWLLDGWLRPISGVPVHDEQPDEVAA